MQNERKDVVRNRAELLAAAEAAVAAHGVDVPMNLIAKTAGVGQGTLYRHFPDRDAMMTALLERSMDDLEAFAATQAGDDALFRVLDYYVSGIDSHFALATSWRVVGRDHPGVIAGRRRFAALMNPLLIRAVAADLCRSDVTLVDIRSLIAMLTAVPTDGQGESTLSDPGRMLGWMMKGICP